MLKDTATLEAKAERFIKAICESELVFALKDRHGFAYLYSNHLQDLDGDESFVLCFWSKMAYAKACQIEDWSDHVIVEIPLDLFLKNWCIGMAKDGSIAGIECDAQLFCVESEPMRLGGAIIKELAKQDKMERFSEHYLLFSDYLDE